MPDAASHNDRYEKDAVTITPELSLGVFDLVPLPPAGR